VSVGFSDEDARSRAALVARVEDSFAARVGGDPRWRVWAPGRVELFGKHTDYAGGGSLVAAVPRGFVVAARERGDSLVRVIDAGRQIEILIDPAETTRTHQGWATYVATVVRRLAANFPGAHLSADVVFASDLPPAAGLSSSSALVVGLAAVLIQRGGLTIREEYRETRGTLEGLAGYFGAMEAGADYGRLTGTTGVGTHGGSEDHAAIVGSRPGMATEYRYVPVRRVSDVALPPEWACVIATSGVHADKIGAARNQFNRAAAGIRALVDIWRRTSGDEPASLADALARDPDAGTRLAAAVREVPIPDFSADDLLRRLRHFQRENPRVPDAARALAAGDAARIDALSRDSQTDAETLLGNQVPETTALVAAARAAGAFAASSFGAGFGGSVWALVPSSNVARFGSAWIERYRRHYPLADGVAWFAARPSPGLLVLPPMRPSRFRRRT
jgi:galactokinase